MFQPRERQRTAYGGGEEDGKGRSQRVLPRSPAGHTLRERNWMKPHHRSRRGREPVPLGASQMRSIDGKTMYLGLRRGEGEKFRVTDETELWFPPVPVSDRVANSRGGNLATTPFHSRLSKMKPLGLASRAVNIHVHNCGFVLDCSVTKTRQELPPHELPLDFPVISSNRGSGERKSTRSQRNRPTVDSARTEVRCNTSSILFEPRI
jgi:hypothetical protein